MKRIEITRPFFNICSMQVCAVKDATDKEILDICNIKNPSGTSAGWTTVIREIKKESIFQEKNKLPVQCKDYPDRLHLIILC